MLHCKTPNFGETLGFTHKYKNLPTRSCKSPKTFKNNLYFGILSQSMLKFTKTNFITQYCSINVCTINKKSFLKHF